MIIFKEKKLIFIKTAKTAGTTIEIILRKYTSSDDIITELPWKDELLRHTHGVDIAPKNHKVIRPKRWANLRGWIAGLIRVNFSKIPIQSLSSHATISEAHRLFPGTKEYQSFAVSRCPYQVHASAYSYMKRKHGNLKDYPSPDVWLQLYGPIVNFNLIEWDGEVPKTTIIEYSNLTTVLPEYLSEYEFPREDLHRDLNLIRAKSGSRSSNPEEMFSVESLDLITKANEREISMYDYTP
ncbi:MAG: hypothetical protein ACPGQC_01535 [Limisphaerales bacterium]